MITSTRSVRALAALLLLGVSASATAAPYVSTEPMTKTVRLADLDLSKAAGAETLYKRITAAARVVCRHTARMEMLTCRSHAVAEAVATIDNPLLSSMHHRSTSNGVAEVVLR